MELFVKYALQLSILGIWSWLPTVLSIEPLNALQSSQQSSYSCSEACLDPPVNRKTTSDKATTTQDLTTTHQTFISSDDIPGYSCDRLSGHCLYGCPGKDLAGPFCNMSCFNNGVYNCEKCGYNAAQSSLVCEQCSKNFYLTAAGRCVECPKQCRAYNSSTSRCNHDDGHCDSGCVNHFGINCDKQCNALCLPRVCEQFDGCCSNDCLFDTHCGCQCDLHCNQNCLSKTCNADCTCKEGCLPGFYGPTCNTACSSNCVSLNGLADTCNATNGHCYYGCVNDTTWTEICEEQCSNGCINNTCDQYSGECIDGCINDEWHGQDCNKKCSRTCDNQRCVREYGTCLLGCVPGQWGDYCESPCNKNCRNQTCDRYNKTCAYGCVPGHWGDYCESHCNKNCRNQTCDRFNETCTDGCTDGFYGQRCHRTCSVTCRNDICNFISGVCLHGCKGQYKGDFCADASAGLDADFGIIVLSFVVALAMMTTVFLGYCLMRKCVHKRRKLIEPLTPPGSVNTYEMANVPDKSEHVYTDVQDAGTSHPQPPGVYESTIKDSHIEHVYTGLDRHGLVKVYENL